VHLVNCHRNRHRNQFVSEVQVIAGLRRRLEASEEVVAVSDVRLTAGKVLKRLSLPGARAIYRIGLAVGQQIPAAMGLMPIAWN
jgi:hypothetical protein